MRLLRELRGNRKRLGEMVHQTFTPWRDNRVLLLEGTPARSLLIVVGAPGRPTWRAGSPWPPACPGAAATRCTLQFKHATVSGGAFADRLWMPESAAVTLHLHHCGRHTGVVAWW